MSRSPNSVFDSLLVLGSEQVFVEELAVCTSVEMSAESGKPNHSSLEKRGKQAKQIKMSGSGAHVTYKRGIVSTRRVWD